MNKLLSALILCTFAFTAQAASHAGGAPMKAEATKAAEAAPAAKKKMGKKAAKKKAVAAPEAAKK